MSIKKYIEEIYKNNTDYTKPIQAVNQADSIKALSTDLYTDSSRFIYELLQNADDSYIENGLIKVWIKVFDNTLVIAHSGKTFDKNDVIGICNINNGTKKSDISKTGYKGIGFKSVFGQSEKVIIYSEDEYFRFDSSYDFRWRQEWGNSQLEWENDNNRSFQFPWQIIPIYTQHTDIPENIDSFIKSTSAKVATIIEIKHILEISDAIKKLARSTNMFLFLKNICEINFIDTENTSIIIDRRVNDRIVLKDGKKASTEWLIKKINLTIPEILKHELLTDSNIPQKLKEATNIEMFFAAQVDDDKIINISSSERLLYSYLPTNETKYNCPVLINTNFLTTANRETIHKSQKWNQWIFERIPVEIYKWVSELVISEFSYDSYKLIPSESNHSDDLACQYNEGIRNAKDSIAFILGIDNELYKINEVLIDHTFLSEKSFIRKDTIIKFVSSRQGCNMLKQYAKQIQNIRNIGIASFDWENLDAYLISDLFTATHSKGDNIALINYLKYCCDAEKIRVDSKFVSRLPFIIDHKGNLCSPDQICFPTADDSTWNNITNELSFVNQDLYNWLMSNHDEKMWLEELGVKEKTDITYITQNILPNIDSYINTGNAIIEIQKLYDLYKKGELMPDIIGKLSNIKLLTTKGALLSACKCYLSDYYVPRLKLEGLLNEDVFISEQYCQNISDKDEWKLFFKLLKVSDGIKTIDYKSRVTKSTLIAEGFVNDYFLIDGMSHKPFIRTFNADEFDNIKSLQFIADILLNYDLSVVLWNDYISNNNPDEITRTATAFWGDPNRYGRNSGDSIVNYLPWLVKNTDCIPTCMKTLEKSSSVFLNTDEIIHISGNYLPIFNGPSLSQDWVAFFKFKSQLKLRDYLAILNAISLESKENNKTTLSNKNRVQQIYKTLLDESYHWNAKEIDTAKKWAKNHALINTKGVFTDCSNLYYYIDGNESIFQDQFQFIMLNAENKNHKNLEKWLSYFGVKVLRQDQFNLRYDSIAQCAYLRTKIAHIIPFLKAWIQFENIDDSTLRKLERIDSKLNALTISESTELVITYEEIDFSKNVNLHYSEQELVVTTPWNSNSVLLRLPNVLCRHFKLEGHEGKLDFLLRSDSTEIQQYFAQENMPFSDEWSFDNNEDVSAGIMPSQISEFYEENDADYEKKLYIGGLIDRAMTNVLSHIKTLSMYDCKSVYKISNSIWGGVKKNGNDIAIIARPSDNGRIKLYYDAEYNALEYVDTELWYEDGVTPPRQFSFGQILKLGNVNNIPIKHLITKDIEVDNPKSEILEFSPIPYSPEQTAEIISSFANAEGGTLIYGVKEIDSENNEIVGLSSDFNVIDITNKAIAMLTPVPNITYDWVQKGSELIFVIEVLKEGDETRVLSNNQQYIRIGRETRLMSDNKPSQVTYTLNKFKPNKTVAIIIAIEDYCNRPDYQVPPVKHALNDAKRVREMLINHLDVADEDIYVLQNEEAMKTSLEYDFKSLFNSLTENDRLIFYYAGHGFHNGVSNCLSTYDMHPENIGGTSIELDKILLNPLKKSKCRNAMIFIDACAQSFNNKFARDNIMGISEDSLRVFTNDHPYYAIFTSCQIGEKSYSCDTLEDGIWTHYLVKAISEAPQSALLSNKYLTDRMLQNYLVDKVTGYVKAELNMVQNPRLIVDSTIENVILEVTNTNRDK